MVDDDGSGTTGTVINAAWKTELYDQIDALAGGTNAPWLAYTPVWLSSPAGTFPGDSALNGVYSLIGRTVHFAMWIIVGAGANLTGHPWVMGLPVNAGNLLGIYPAWIHSSGVANYLGVAVHADAQFLQIATNASASLVSGVSPFAWKAGDQFRIAGTYEAASALTTLDQPVGSSFSSPEVAPEQ
jgi:hypothetical protein